MDTMYSTGKKYYKKRRVRTLFIGRRLMVSVVFCMVAFTVVASVCFIVSKCRLSSAPYFRQILTVNAFPLVAASSGQDVFELEKSFSDFALGTDFKGKRLNFRSVPFFYSVNRIERSEATSGRDFVSHIEKEENSDVISIPEEKVSEQTNPSEGLRLKNETTYTIDTDALFNEPCDILLTHKEPEILIVHTHASESYTQSDKYRYSQSDYARCQDTRYNVVRVGDELESELKKRGFNVLHDKTINDYPSYNKSYTKTLGVIESYLEKYPSIKCVFDVHRDAVVGENDTKIKFTADIAREKVSQIMIVCGSDQLGLENSNWQKNLSTALKIQGFLNKKYPGLMRPVNLRKERFNLHKTTGSFIFEFGTHGNTLDEVLASVKYFADGIEAVLK